MHWNEGKLSGYIDGWDWEVVNWSEGQFEGEERNDGMDSQVELYSFAKEEISQINRTSPEG